MPYFNLVGQDSFAMGLPSLSPSFTPVCILHNSPSHWLTKRAPKPKKYHDFFFDPNIMTSTTTNKRNMSGPTLKSSQWSDYSVPSVAAMWCLKFRCLKKKILSLLIPLHIDILAGGKIACVSIGSRYVLLPPFQFVCPLFDF